MEKTHDHENVEVTIDNRHAYIRVHFRREYEEETNSGDIIVTHYKIIWCDEDFPCELLTDSILTENL